MSPTRRWRLAALAGALLAAGPARADQAADSTRFVVLGHIRGGADGLNPRLGELLAEVRALRPAFVVLTGDIIWGDVMQPPTDPDRLRHQWEAVDSALSGLGVPVHRVPGNHDISDLASRDVWRERYGPIPAAVTERGLRLLLLSSAWIPGDGDTSASPHIRGVDLDAAQVAWLADELAQRPAAQPVFVFMHHLLWWQEPGGRWWTEVHPLLARAGVAAVFSGDYGPLKFSTLKRDGVRYYQSSIETPVALALLRNRISSRVLSSQFDNYLSVDVVGGQARVTVQTVGEESSGEFTPERHRAITAPGPEPEARPLWRRAWDLVGSPARLSALGGLALLAFGAGFLVGRRRR